MGNLPEIKSILSYRILSYLILSYYVFTQKSLRIKTANYRNFLWIDVFSIYRLLRVRIINMNDP